MKQFFLLLAIFSFVTISGAQAQNAAAHAASQDASIVKQMDKTTGEISYAKKTVCPNTGTVTYTPVEYCLNSKQFIAAKPVKRSACTKSALTANAYHVSSLENSKTLTQSSAAQKAACVVANQKARKVKATFVSNKAIKP